MDKRRLSGTGKSAALAKRFTLSIPVIQSDRTLPVKLKQTVHRLWTATLPRVCSQSIYLCDKLIENAP
jgi:hypothetical protein